MTKLDLWRKLKWLVFFWDTVYICTKEQLALEMCWSQPVSPNGQNLASKTKQPFYRVGALDGSAVLYCKNRFCITGYLLRQ